MKERLFSTFMLILSCSICHGGTIDWDIANFGYDSYWGLYRLSIVTSIPSFSSFVSARFRTEVTASPEQASFNNFWQSGGGYCGFLSANYGELIDYSLFANYGAYILDYTTSFML